MAVVILTCFVAVMLGVHLLSAAMTAWRYLRPGKPAGTMAGKPPFIAVLRPVCGLDPFDRETLASTFALDYPDFEILFCAPCDDDPACALVRALIAEHSHVHPHVRARLLTGLDHVSANPKLNNLHKGVEGTQAQWLAMVDSNLMMPRDYLHHLLAQWDEKTGLVSAPPVGERPENIWGSVEAAFLNGNQARWQIAADALGFGFAQGKSLFWRRDILMAGGGLPALGRNMAEDVASTKLVRDRGLKVRLARRLFAQPIGHRSARAIWDRQLRWSRVRRDGFLPIFIAEILQGPALPFLAALTLVLLGAAHWGTLVAFIALWYGAEWLLARVTGWPARPRDLLAFVLRDAMLIPLWIMTWCGRDFTWRGTDMSHKQVTAAK